MRHALGHSARVDENQSSPMRLDQLCQPMIDFLPHFIRHHRFQRRLGDFDCQIEFATMTDIDDFAIRVTSIVNCMSTDQKTRECQPAALADFYGYRCSMP